MIKIIGNNELSVAGIKFSLPLNFYIDIEGMETIHQDGLRLMSEEKQEKVLENFTVALHQKFSDNNMPVLLTKSAW